MGEEVAEDCGGCCGVGRVYVKEEPEQQDHHGVWRPSALGLSEICKEELVPDALAHGSTDDDRCAWLRSQLIGSDVRLSTPFGDRDLTYADFTASGRCVRHIEEFMIRAVMPHYGNTHAEDSYVGDTTAYLVNESARYIRHRLGASPSDALLFCGSGCTSAVKRLQDIMGLSVPSLHRHRLLVSLPDNERWVVFIGPFEHHSNLLSWRQSLAEVVEIPINQQGLLDLVFLEAALQDPKYAARPKLGSFSACSNVTGILTDTKHLASLLHQYGAFACFDFASSAPYVDINMQADGYDAVVLSPHKFVGGPGSPGLLLVNKKLYLLQDSAPSIAGGGAVDFVNGYTEQDTLYLKDVEAREDAGTPPILQKIKAALAFWIKEEMGSQLIESREQHFITTALKRLSKNPNVLILGNTDVKRAAILSFLVYATEEPREQEIKSTKRKILQGRFIVKLLDDLFGIQARGGCSCAGPYGHALLNVDHRVSLKLRDAIQKGYGGVRLGWARLNFAYFISYDEFEFLLSAIEFAAEYGQRFIPLYDFNWRSGNWTFKHEMRKLVSIKLQNSSFPGLSKYHRYLAEATAFARDLPEHPTDREIPQNIDVELVDFKV